MTEEFLHQKEEYLTLRKEVENALSDISTIERNCLLAISAVYVWLFSQSLPITLDKKIGWAVPVFLAIFSALRCYSIGKHLVTIGRYIEGIEEINKPGGETNIGWETYFGLHGRQTQTKVRKWFWGLIIFLTTTVWLSRLFC
ncbi:hypothetical protein [Methylomonas koyamae]|uniref:hypothetical protein n=1 Tax=Methylomonas koyamae TaxID=702114 RepID=UPI002873E136|nr:hypothetical protein [Methylomonas koyamae]WNB74037.1 hypothetical protein RI210_12145 [Methylomonas koyamae]